MKISTILASASAPALACTLLLAQVPAQAQDTATSEAVRASSLASGPGKTRSKIALSER